MQERLMLLPTHDFSRIRLIRIPEDYSERDAVRRVTALIAETQEQKKAWDWDDLAAVLEDHGFAAVDYTPGPELD